MVMMNCKLSRALFVCQARNRVGPSPIHFINLLNVFKFCTGDVRGVNELWMLGDNFLASTYRNHFEMSMLESCFMKSSFEVSPHCGSRFASNNTNMLSRIQNSVCKALNSANVLSKYMVFMLDGDLIDFLNYTQFGLSGMLGRWIEWLAKEVSLAVQLEKKLLPKKALREQEPFIYWIAAPFHDNFGSELNAARSKFNACLDSVIKLHNNMRVMKLKEFWNPKNRNLVNDHNHMITLEGWSIYWCSIDEAIHFNVKRREDFLLRSLSLKLQGTAPVKQLSYPRERDDMKTFFHRHRPDKQQYCHSNDGSHYNRFMLPHPK